MKSITWAAVAGSLVLLMVLGMGCSEDKTIRVEDDGSPGFMQIVYPETITDTLEFLPGDSASMGFYVRVSDRNGVAVSGVPVEISLENPSLGTVELAKPEEGDTTDGLGRLNLIFRTIGQPGVNKIKAQAGGISASRQIVIQESDEVVSTLNVNVNPDRLEVTAGQEDSALVTVTIADEDQQGIQGIKLRLRATGGRFSELPVTNSNGKAITWWYSNNQSGTFSIWVRAGNLADTARIEVDEVGSVFGTLEVFSSKERIKADNCVTRAEITARLRDAFGTAVVGDTIWFGTPGLGVMEEPSGVTDLQGQVKLYFCEESIPCDTDSAMVVARYAPWALRDTVKIWIAPAALVGQVALSATRLEGVAGIDSTSLQVTAQYEDGTFVDGLRAKFFASCNDGHFTYDSLLLAGGHTLATNYWRFCQSTDVAAQIWCYVDTVRSNTVNIFTRPGDPTGINLDVNPLVTPINGSVAAIATVIDSFGNEVEAGTPVSFSTTLGTVNPQISQTDNEGVAISTMRPGTQAGQASIKAIVSSVFADSVLVTILPGYAHTIELSVSNSSLQVAGTGGIDQSQLRATVLDANQNPVPDGAEVEFTILQGPGGGVNINNNGNSDTAPTSGGLAVATLNAGITPGPVQIQACTYVDDEAICAMSTIISIVAGPPVTIQIGVDSDGIDAGGSAWDIEVSAQVMDQYNNPVRCNLAVFFSVEPNICQILSENVVTCNTNVEGDTRPGTAFTALRYTSEFTFQNVVLTAWVAEPGVSDQFDLQLPIQIPAISLECDPSAWYYDDPDIDQPDPSHIKCIAVVKDGHENRINGAEVRFLSTKGHFYTQEFGGQETSTRLTGLPPEDDGTAVLWLRARESAVFLIPQEPEVTAEVRATIVNYGEATDTKIVIFSHIPG